MGCGDAGWRRKRPRLAIAEDWSRGSRCRGMSRSSSAPPSHTAVQWRIFILHCTAMRKESGSLCDPSARLCMGRTAGVSRNSATHAQPRAAGSEGLPLSMVAFRNIPSWNVPKGTSGRPPLRPIRTAVDESQSWGFPHLCDPSTAVRLGRKCCRSACIPIGIFRVGLCARVAQFFTRTHSLAVLHWGKPQGCTACQSTGAACGSSALAVPHVLHPAQVAGM